MQAFHQVFVTLFRTQTICSSGSRAATVVAEIQDNTRPQFKQAREVPPIQRQVVDGLIAERSAQGRAADVEQGDLFGDGNRLRLRARHQDDINGQVLADLQTNVLALPRLK